MRLSFGSSYLPFISLLGGGEVSRPSYLWLAVLAVLVVILVVAFFVKE